MVEIALCIAIIGFALVAIIGVLPAAMRIQQDNRADTLIDQDGNYFMEAIRHGAQGLDELTNYVYDINLIQVTAADPTPKPKQVIPLFPPARRIIGALSVPFGYSPDQNEYFVIRSEAKVRAISGAAVEKDPSSLISFDYLLTSEISPFGAFDPGTAFETASTNNLQQIQKDLTKSLYEVRLTFRWPFSAVTGNVGNNKKVFRALVSGSLMDSTNDFFFFQPTTFKE